jgi:predicted DNA-binding transcriptional regulator YafY
MLNQFKILRIFQLITLLKIKPGKSIRFMSHFLDTSDRTVYRYLDLLDEIGFKLNKDKKGHYMIHDEGAEGSIVPFTHEEVQMLKQMIMTVASDHPLRDGLLKKVYLTSEAQIHASNILKARLSKIVTNLSAGMQTGKQVILKNYHSLNSGHIGDRLIEPVRFTVNYKSIAAYEVKSGKNKLFRLDRIGDVEVTDKTFRYRVSHEYKPQDVFGFTLGSKRIKVDLLLSMKAFLLLREEYPMTEPFMEYDAVRQSYRLVVEVSDMKAITRFVLGLHQEIMVCGSEAFRNHIRKSVKRLVDEK